MQGWSEKLGEGGWGQGGFFVSEANSVRLFPQASQARTSLSGARQHFSRPRAAPHWY